MLPVEALPLSSGPTGLGNLDAFDVRCFGAQVTVMCGEGGEHVLFGDGLRHLQLAVTAGSVLDGPVCLRYLLTGFRHLEMQILALQRLHGLHRLGRLPRGLFPRERRAGRWLSMLRAWDGLEAGASQREVAAALFGERAATEDWEAGYRARVQRLLRGARGMVEGGYRRLLNPEEEGGPQG